MRWSRREPGWVKVERIRECGWLRVGELCGEKEEGESCEVEDEGEGECEVEDEGGDPGVTNGVSRLSTSFLNIISDLVAWTLGIGDGGFELSPSQFGSRNASMLSCVIIFAIFNILSVADWLKFQISVIQVTTIQAVISHWNNNLTCSPLINPPNKENPKTKPKKNNNNPIVIHPKTPIHKRE
jgi:hypothetical protein